MPLHDYSCPACGAEFELIMKKVKDAVDCPDCGKTAGRRLSAPAHFEYAGQGASDNDYSEGDKFVGRDADFRRQVVAERKKAIAEVRKSNNTVALMLLGEKTADPQTATSRIGNRVPTKDEFLSDLAPLSKDLLQERGVFFDKARQQGLLDKIKDAND